MLSVYSEMMFQKILGGTRIQVWGSPLNSISFLPGDQSYCGNRGGIHILEKEEEKDTTFLWRIWQSRAWFLCPHSALGRLFR
jgi:hypothetical protein